MMAKVAVHMMSQLLQRLGTSRPAQLDKAA